MIVLIELFRNALKIEYDEMKPFPIITLRNASLDVITIIYRDPTNHTVRL